MLDILESLYSNVRLIAMLGAGPSVPVLAFLALLIVVLVVFVLPGPKSRGVYRRGRFMTANERSFFHALEEALGEDYRISAQVRLGDLVDVDPRVHGSQKQAALNKVLCKSVDFVVVLARTLDPVAVIEVDDRSHLLPVRRERDAFVNAVFAEIGLPLVRAPAHRVYSVPRIRKMLADAGVGCGWEAGSLGQAAKARGGSYGE